MVGLGSQLADGRLASGGRTAAFIWTPAGTEEQAPLKLQAHVMGSGRCASSLTAGWPGR